MREALLVKYGEISLRGDNRRIYEKRLLHAVRRRLENFAGMTVSRENGRFIVQSDNDTFDYEHIIPDVAKVLGLIGLSPCIMLEYGSLEQICQAAVDFMRKHRPVGRFTFKVKTRRANKSFPLHSQEISAEVGGRVLDSLPNATVNVHSPDFTLYIELRNQIYIYADTVKTLGGLPYGTSGRGMLLMSGGIDSPTAGFMMARRGVDITAVYFHSPPYTSERAKDKVVDLARKLCEYTEYYKLYIVPFTNVQLCLYQQAPPEKLTILLKRSMLRIAQTLAEKEKCQCLVTGDSIGQVASQTMQSIAAVQSAASLPIIRPLAGMDKQQIIDLARQIGTFDISIRPYEDCCTIFVAEHPETKPKASIIEAVERRIKGLDELTRAATEGAEILELRV